MDHLPLVREPYLPNAYRSVPVYASVAKYGCLPRAYQGFRHFPTEYGFDSDSLRKILADGTTNETAISLLQEWLFFGLLVEISAVFGVPIKRNDFVRQSSGDTAVLYTGCLQEYPWHWSIAGDSWTMDLKRQNARSMHAYLSLSRLVLSAWASSGIASSFKHLAEYDRINVTLLSLAVLYEHLSCAVNELYSSTMDAIGIQLVSRIHSPCPREALLAAGWCCHIVEHLIAKQGISTILFLGTFNMQKRGRSHDMCKRATKCIANQIDFKTYRTRHADGCDSSCGALGPDMGKVKRILESGGVPLVGLDVCCEPACLEVVRYEEEGMNHNDDIARTYVYIAISHVWSDGLGNPHTNSLPVCQVQRLQRLVNSVFKDPPIYTIPFWIDTFFVPLDPDLKTIALERMAMTYAAASMTLVLHNTLAQSKSTDSQVELYMCAEFSTWVTRLWTYQEGRLSHNLLFQLSDRAVTLADFRGTSTFHNQRILELVSDTLLAKWQTYGRLTPCEIKLARVLAATRPVRITESIQRYAELPPQQDAAEEEERLSAIRRLEEDKADFDTSSIWKPVLGIVSPSEMPTSADWHLRDQLAQAKFDPVRDGLERGVLSSVSGVGYSYDVNPRTSDVFIQGSARFNRFMDVSRGFRKRTTSRLEDEPICISVLLGLRISNVSQIPVLHWRTKDRLSRIENLVRSLSHGHLDFGINKLLSTSQEKRMKAVFAQIEEFSEQIIFWPVPRLHGRGWGWAPSSFLLVEDPVRFILGGPHCMRREEGLVVKTSAILLNAQNKEYTKFADFFNQTTSKAVHLAPEFQADHGLPVSEICRYSMRLRKDGYMVSRRHQLSCLSTNTVPQFAFLSQWAGGTVGRSDRGRDLRAVVLITGKHESCIFTRFIGLVKEEPVQSDVRTIWLEAEYQNKQNWCIG